MREVVPRVGVLIVDNDNVLLITKKDLPNGSYQLPGGQIDVENHESPEEAACRELAETTNLTVDCSDMIRVPDEWSAEIERVYGTKTFSFICFASSRYSGTATETDKACPKWVAISRVSEVDIAPNALDAIEAGYSLIINSASK
jgi:ADP-ribose pyrophosphatase YjhB (NUDIX family)